MAVIEVFGVIAAIIILGFLAEIMFRKTNIPDVLLLIIVGIVIGTILSWVSPEDLPGTELFTTFALIYLLFQGSLNIHFKALVRSLGSTLTLTLLGFVLTVLIVAAIMFAFTRDILLSLLVGMTLGGTSSAVVVPVVKNLTLADTRKLVLVLESAISDVLCIVGAITIIKIISTGTAVPSEVFKHILSSFSLAVVVGALLGFVYVLLMSKFSTLTHAHMVGVAMVIAVYAFVESPFVGASGAIACLAFGLVLGNGQGLLSAISKVKREEKEYEADLEHSDVIVVRSVLSPEAKSFYAEISFFVKVFFFVYLGILIDFSNPMAFVYGALLTLAIYIIRPLAVAGAFRKEDLEDKERTLLEVLIPKGLAAAVLAQLAVQADVPGASEVANVILSVVLLSILLTSVLVFMAERGWFQGFWRLFVRPAEKETKA